MKSWLHHLDSDIILVRRKCIDLVILSDNFSLLIVVQYVFLTICPVASSSFVHPNEIHLYVEHLKYQTKSAVVRTSPLLADTQELVQQRGAASDYIVSKSLPRHYIAIDIMECLANLKRDDNDYERKVEELKFNLSDERKQLLKCHAHLDDDEIDAIVERASGYSGGQVMFKNLLRAITDEISDTADPRDLSVVLKSYESPRFRLPTSMMSNPQPVIMIAGGTGLAPFRGMFRLLVMFNFSFPSLPLIICFSLIGDINSLLAASRYGSAPSQW